MKSKNIHPIFVEYDDNNLDHIKNSPDYGQVNSGSKSTFWNEIDSPQFKDLVNYLTEKIISNNKIKIFPLNSP